MKNTIFGILGSIGLCGLIYSPLIITPCCSNEGERLEELHRKGRSQIVGTVIEEKYENRLESVPERHINGAVSQAYSNETVRLDSNYTLKIRKDDDGKIIGVSVLNGPDVKKEALEIIVDKGSRVSFPKGNLEEIEKRTPTGKRVDVEFIPNETYFNEQTQYGNKRVDRITVLGEE